MEKNKKQKKKRNHRVKWRGVKGEIYFTRREIFPFAEIWLARFAIRLPKFEHSPMNFSSRILSISRRFHEGETEKVEGKEKKTEEEEEEEPCRAIKLPTRW